MVGLLKHFGLQYWQFLDEIGVRCYWIPQPGKKKAILSHDNLSRHFRSTFSLWCYHHAQIAMWSRVNWLVVPGWHTFALAGKKQTFTGMRWRKWIASSHQELKQGLSFQCHGHQLSYNHWATTSPHILLLCLTATNVFDLDRKQTQHGSFSWYREFYGQPYSLVPPRPLPITYSTGPTQLFVACRVYLQYFKWQKTG